MSHIAINAALSLRLKALGYPTYYENQSGFVPPSGVYLAEAFLPADTFQVGLENCSTDDYRGVYQIMVMAPRDAYKFSGLDVANDVKAHFKRGLWLDSYGLSVFPNYPTRLVRCERVSQGPAITQGDRWGVPVSVDFRAMIRG